MILPKKINNEQGVAHLVLIISAIGLLLFLLVTNTFSFRSKIFGTLFPKFFSRAAGNATLTLPTSVSASVETAFDLPVTLNTDTPVIGVDALITFDKTKISVVDVTPQAVNVFKTFYPLDNAGSFNKSKVMADANQNGLLKVGAAAFDSTSKLPQLGFTGTLGVANPLMTVRFLGVVAGQSNISFKFVTNSTTNSNIVSQADASNILTSTQNTSVTIGTTASPTPTTPPVGGVINQPAILEFYYMKSTLQDYGIMKYRPRQFNTSLNWNPGDYPGTIRVTNPGPYNNWDILNTPSGSPEKGGFNGIVAEPEWVKIGLNRAAKLAIVWRGGSSIPSWLSSWTNTGVAGNVNISGNTYPTYTKAFAAGEYFFGSMYDSNGSAPRDSYLVLFAEANGTPSNAPSAPQGQVVPTPNDYCPTWVHGTYTAVGPDGKTYETWHNIIDPVYWCYFGHEHGSNPKYFDPNFKPVYRYTSQLDDMDEPPAGFKGVYIEDTENGTTTQVYYTMHFGTAGLKRACTRFHTIDIAFKDKPTGKLLGNFHTMSDFGPSVDNSNHIPLTPRGPVGSGIDCPNQGQEALYPETGTNDGERQFPIPGHNESLTYEPWRIDARNLDDNLGLIASSLLLNTINPMVTCATVDCIPPAYVITGSKGDQRYGQYGPLGIRPTAFNQGTFYTNAQGTKVLTQNDPGAVQQFAAPGANFRLTLPSDDTNCQDLNGFGLPFICQGGAPNGYPVDRENSLRSPN